MSDVSGSEDGNDADFQPGVDLKQLPAAMQGRVKALKNLQLDTVKAETEYYSEVHLLDVKYQTKFDEINQRRSRVIGGVHEPTGAELEWPSDTEDEEDDDPEVVLSKKVETLTLHPDFPADGHGLPKFWLHTLKNANEESLMGLVEPHDEPVLAHLTDITVVLNPEDTAGFTLKFHFEENPFFTNQVLTKEYGLRAGPDPEVPLQYDGPEIVSCKGCLIDWKDNMDVTKKIMKVKTISAKKGKGDSPVKAITKEYNADSFFKFFSPPVVKENGDLEDEGDQATLAVDFDVGFAIKEKIIPRAVLYFTGEIFGDDDDFEDIEDEDEEE
jgi:nucleosome assembly protein 1-like 1